MPRSVLTLVLPFLLLSAGLVPAAGGEQYMVEMDLWIDGEQQGTPIVVVAPGKLASVEVADASGDRGWKIDVRVEPPAVSEGAPGGAIWLDLAVYEQREGEWEPLADSLLGVPEGRTGTMSVVEPGVDQASAENSRVHLTTQASRLRPEDTQP